MNESIRKTRSILTNWKSIRMRRGLAWGLMIIGALLAFEMFNYSTTQFALNDLLGNVGFAGMRWATILALAFCGVDFAGIARLFTPEQGRDEKVDVWYLFAAWLLASAMNASLTWWGVAVAISSHTMLSSAIISNTTLIKVIPVFVAIMVWLIRVLIIGTFSVKGGKLFSQAEGRRSVVHAPAFQPAAAAAGRVQPVAAMPVFQPAAKMAGKPVGFSRPEPAQKNLSMHPRTLQAAETVDNPLNS